jgi:hypothetical protein
MCQLFFAANPHLCDSAIAFDTSALPPRTSITLTISKHIRSSMATNNNPLSHSPGAMNTGVSTTVELEKATLSASQYLDADLKSQFEKAQGIWFAIEQTSSKLTDSEGLSGADIDISIRRTAKLIQAAEQLKLRASSYYERLRPLKSIFTRKHNEEETAGEGDDEKKSDDSNS